MVWDRPQSLELNDFKMTPHKAPYGKSHNVIVNGTYIDDIYEGKAHQWMKQKIDTENEKTLLCSEGKRNRTAYLDNIIKTLLSTFTPEFFTFFDKEDIKGFPIIPAQCRKRAYVSSALFRWSIFPFSFLIRHTNQESIVNVR